MWAESFDLFLTGLFSGLLKTKNEIGREKIHKNKYS